MLLESWFSSAVRDPGRQGQVRLSPPAEKSQGCAYFHRRPEAGSPGHPSCCPVSSSAPSGTLCPQMAPISSPSFRGPLPWGPSWSGWSGAQQTPHCGLNCASWKDTRRPSLQYLWTWPAGETVGVVTCRGLPASGPSLAQCSRKGTHRHGETEAEPGALRCKPRSTWDPQKPGDPAPEPQVMGGCPHPDVRLLTSRP